MTQHNSHLKPDDWLAIMRKFQRRMQDMFHVDHVRILVAERRAEAFGTLKEFQGSLEQVVDLTIPYNKRNMENFLESQVVRIIRPLSVIDPVFKSAKDLSVLSIGPRNEMEIFHLWALGFQPKNIKAIDLVSNSPLIDIADMHDIPYEDSSFDVAVSGWALPYSKDHQKAVDEMVRVLKPGGLFCIGFTRIPPEDERARKVERDGSVNHTSTDDILRLIGPANVGDVAFSHDPLDQDEDGAIVLIVRIRK